FSESLSQTDITDITLLDYRIPRMVFRCRMTYLRCSWSQNGSPGNPLAPSWAVMTGGAARLRAILLAPCSADRVLGGCYKRDPRRALPSCSNLPCGHPCKEHLARKGDFTW